VEWSPVSASGSIPPNQPFLWRTSRHGSSSSLLIVRLSYPRDGRLGFYLKPAFPTWTSSASCTGSTSRRYAIEFSWHSGAALITSEQIPPFHQQRAVQWLSGDVAILISDWVTEATRPQSNIPQREFPANQLDEAIDLYMRELARDNVQTRQLFEHAKTTLRRMY